MAQHDDARRDLAKKSFNRAWALIDNASRTQAEDREMLVLAAASRFLWQEAGGDEQQMIGDWQVAHVLSLLGAGELALSFAEAALRRCQDRGWQDWRLASCLEGVARAHAVRGDKAARDDYAARCQAQLEGVPDKEDRDLIASQLATVPTL